MEQEASTRDVEISGLTADSRKVGPGFLFAALAGSKADGAAFITKALERGAAAILASPGAILDQAPRGGAVPFVGDENPRRRLSLMAARFYGRQPANVAAVTGTNGKTSTVAFTRQIWELLGLKAASLGTLGLCAGGIERTGALTTPDPVDLHETLAALRDKGIEHLVLEASSHGLAQHRLDGVDIRAAAFTNLSRDHLDYHGDMESYFRAKRRLFDEIMGPGGSAVLNADTPQFPSLKAACERRGQRVIAYGFKGDDIRIEGLSPRPDGQRLTFVLDGRRHDLMIPMPGAFQAGNLLCALGLAVACGAEPEAAAATLPRLEGAAGRMQCVVRHPDGARLYVDYAHTPAALENALSALRPHAGGRLWLVFGCGGDRDAGKRAAMGEIADRLADEIIVTDDNPRTENAALIRRQIIAGILPKRGRRVREIGDRGQAIAAAVAGLGPDDLLVIAGKGHESHQIVGTERRPFDDAVEARKAVDKLAGGDP